MILIGGQELAFTPDQVLVDIDAESSREAIRPLSQRLVDAGLVEPDFLIHIMAREQEYPTGLPTEPVGVAIPHTDPQHVRSSAMAVGVLSHPVDFGVMGAGDDEMTPVSVIFLLAIAPGTKHMNVLGSLTRLFQSRAFLSQICSASPQDIYSTVVNELKTSSSKG